METFDILDNLAKVFDCGGFEKKCRRCCIFKNINSFISRKSVKFGLCSNCSECRDLKSKYDNTYRIENIDKIRATKKKCYNARRQYYIDVAVTWEKENWDHRKEYMRKYVKNRSEIDINFYLRKLLRSRLCSVLKAKNISRINKGNSAIRYLGMPIEEFKSYLETLFKPGMIWENQGKWHIDHIRPLCSFDLTKEEDLKIACHYTNLQPRVGF
ncbi:MAG: hypothetical protein KGO96_07665 [Elusimicrobia bacterium]|nr:hypothetical protein [Elusimicrobiota bacterium]